MIKKFLNVFKFDKSKLTMEELKICVKIVNIAMILGIISMIIIGICIILTSNGITLGNIGVVAVVIWCISMAVIACGGDINSNIKKREDAKNNGLKAKKIIALIKENKFDEIHCKDKDINKLLLDISLEKRNIEISIREGNIIIKTTDGIEIPLKVENVNDYFKI